MPIKPLVVAMLVGVAGTVAAQGNPASVSLCHEDGDSYPWLIKGKPGYSSIQTQEVEKQLGVPIKLVPRTWKQCLDDVKSGAVDGAINASFSKDRAEFAAYPIKLDGEPDPSKRMYRATYALYKAKGDGLSYDGSKLQGLTGAIGAQTGFSVIAQLKQLGAKVDDSMSKANELLKAVAAGKLQGAALQTTEADDSLGEMGDQKAKIERVATPLAEKPYYTILNKAFAAKYPQFARQLWQTQGKVRESAEIKAKVAGLVKSVD